MASGLDPPKTLTTLRTYDLLDRLETETSPLPDPAGEDRIVEYSYFRNGLRKTVTDPSGLVTAYEYDGKNRLETATTAFETPQAATTELRLPPGRPGRDRGLPERGHRHPHVRQGRPAPRASQRLRRRGGVVLRVLRPERGGEPVSYDANGNRLIQVETNGGVTETTRYTYDDLNRLKSVTLPADSAYPWGGRSGTATTPSGIASVRRSETRRGVVLADRQGVFDNANRLRASRTCRNPRATPSATQSSPRTRTATSHEDGGHRPRRRHHDLRLRPRDKLVEVEQFTAAAPGDVSVLGRFQYDFDGRRNLKIGEDPGDPPPVRLRPDLPSRSTTVTALPKPSTTTAPTA